MKNIALVGIGPHAKRIYLHYFKKKKINLELVIDLESQKESIRKYLDENGFKKTKIFTLSDTYKDDEHLPEDVSSNLFAVCKTLEITHLIISTEPKAHFMYIEFGLKNNMNVLTDKPITVVKNMTSLHSIEKVRKQYYEILDLAKKSKGTCKVMCQRQYHRGIVDRETWNKCQEIADKRSGKYTADGRPDKFSQVYPFSSKIICGLCGENYIRRSWKGHKEGDPRRVAWACKTYNTDHLSCQSYGNVKESYIEELFVNMYSVLCKYNKEVIEKLLITIEETFENDDYSNELKKLEQDIKAYREQVMELLDIRLAKVIDNDVFEEKRARINKKIELLEIEAKKIREYISHRDKVKDRVDKFKTIFQKNATLKEFDADVFESIIDKIIIGRRNEDGSIDPYEVRFFLKTGDELTDTLPIKKIPSQTKNERDDANERMDELQSQLGAYAHNGEHGHCFSKIFDCYTRTVLSKRWKYQDTRSTATIYGWGRVY